MKSSRLRVTSAVMPSYASLSRCGQDLYVSSSVIFTSVQESRSQGHKSSSPACPSIPSRETHSYAIKWASGISQTDPVCVCWALQLPYLKATVGSGLPGLPHFQMRMLFLYIVARPYLLCLLSSFTDSAFALPLLCPLGILYCLVISSFQQFPSTPRPVRQGTCYTLVLLLPAGEWNTLQDPTCTITANTASLLQHD